MSYCVATFHLLNHLCSIRSKVIAFICFLHGENETHSFILLAKVFPMVNEFNCCVDICVDDVGVLGVRFIARVFLPLFDLVEWSLVIAMFRSLLKFAPIYMLMYIHKQASLLRKELHAP